MADIDFKQFPSTRYQGSKRKILPWIHSVVKDIEFETVLDACGGSASVSYLFKKMGKSVTYNDKLKFNHIIGKTLIENNNVTFLKEDLETLFSHDNDGNKFIQKVFKDIYYLPRENKWLDRIANGIVNMNHYEGNELEFKKAIAYYALFQSSLIKRPFNLFHRKNLTIRTADVDRQFGNKTTWEKSFKAHFLNFIDEVNNCVFDSGRNCVALNESLFDIDPAPYDLIYIDPPYLNKDGTNETSNYLRCYHFLEGLASYNEWNDFVDLTTINRRFKQVPEDNEFSKQNIFTAFERMISKFQNNKIVISYKIGGIPSIRHIIDVMKRYKGTVYTKTLRYHYALNRQNGDAKKNREVLIIGE